VKILVAVHALVVPHGIGDPVYMAFFTGNLFVLVLQPETGFGVVECLVPVEHMEGFNIMALGAGLPELVMMKVGMAIRAGCELDPGELLEFFAILQGNFVAFITCNGLMLALQLIFRPGMIEFHRRLEAFGTMTIGAGCAQGLLVVINMTGKAGRV